MAKELVSNALWAGIEPLFPPEPPKPRGGRPRIGNRAALTGILFVLKTGIPWEMLPQEMGCGSGMTCWRRLRDWQVAGVWDDLHLILLDRLGLADQIDWSRASLDSGTVPAPGGDNRPAPIRRTEVNRARSATWWSTAKVFPGDQTYGGQRPRFADAGDDDGRHSRCPPIARAAAETPP